MKGKEQVSRNNSEETIQRHAEDIDKVRSTWQMQLAGLEVPSDGQLWLWLRLHGFDLQTVFWGIGQTARRHANSPLVFDHAVRYCSAAMNRYRKPITRPSLPDSKYFV